MPAAWRGRGEGKEEERGGEGEKRKEERKERRGKGKREKRKGKGDKSSEEIHPWRGKTQKKRAKRAEPPAGESAGGMERSGGKVGACGDLAEAERLGRDSKIPFSFFDDFRNSWKSKIT